MNSMNAALYQSLFQQAALLNAEGVECLAAGNGADAFRNFRDAVQIMAKITNDAFDSLPAVDNMLMVEEEAMEVSSKSVPKLEDACYFVYNHPIFFAPPRVPSQCHTQTSVAALLFNMALTCHQSFQCNTVMTTKALFLYEQVISVVHACSSYLDVTPTQLYTIQMIAISNHTHLLSAMGQLEQAKEGLEVLRSMLPRLQDQELAAPSPLLVTNSKNVLDELFLNIIMVPGTNVVAAAA